MVSSSVVAMSALSLPLHCVADNAGFLLASFSCRIRPAAVRPRTSRRGDRPCDQASHLLGRGGADWLVGHLVSAPEHDDAVSNGEHVGHAVADQDYRHTLIAEVADEV